MFFILNLTVKDKKMSDSVKVGPKSHPPSDEVRFRARLDRRICSPRVCCTFDFLPFLLSSYIGGPKHHCWSDTFTFLLAALQPRSFGYKMRSPFCMRNKIKMLPRLPLFFQKIKKKQGNKTHPALHF